jgi:ferredoxin-NADP reductase
MQVLGTTTKRAEAGAPDIPAVVTSRRLMTADIVRLTLGDPAGGVLPPWAPGAHIDLILNDGMVRQYSLCGSPGDTEWTIMVLREEPGRGGSRQIHDRVEVGHRLVVRGPRNNFELGIAPKYRFLAGGIGITPLLPMLADAERSCADWTLTYCGRTRASMALVDDLVLRYGDRIRVHADDVDGMFDVRGFLSQPSPGELVYACGPAGLLDAVLAEAGGWPAGSIRFERFEALDVDMSADLSFEVELALTGTVLTVPADRSILDVVSEAGIQTLSSCQEGTCGTCETPVLSGEIDHRDAVLSAEERIDGDVMMICVSRAACGRLVLDL